MKLTLLDVVQEVLSNLSSDEVNSIGDTTESLQIANIVKQKYRDIVARSNNPEHNTLISLTPSNDSEIPTVMYLPASVSKIEWLKYFNDSDTGVDGYQYVIQLPIEQFMSLTGGFNPEESEVQTLVLNNGTEDFNIRYKDNKQPSYFAILANHYVLFDSYDSDVDSTLQNSKTLCFGRVTPTFEMVDSFIPDLDDDQFALLVSEVKALAFYELKQMPHAKAEQEIKRQWSTLQKNKNASEKPTSFEKLPDFGRRGSMNVHRRWWNGPFG